MKTIILSLLLTISANAQFLTVDGTGVDQRVIKRSEITSLWRSCNPDGLCVYFIKFVDDRLSFSITEAEYERIATILIGVQETGE